MTRLRETITTPVSIEEAFRYTSDFANLAEWDPGVAESARAGNEPPGVGSRFDVTVAFGSRRIPMVYTTTAFDPPNRVVLVGEGSALTAVDEITFVAIPQGTVITYGADLTFKGAMRFIAPFMGPVLKGVGRRALEGLARVLHDRPPTAT